MQSPDARDAPRGYNSKYCTMMTIRPTDCPTDYGIMEGTVWIACPLSMGPENAPATILGQQPKDSGQSVHYWVFRTARLSSSFLLSRPIPRDSLINTTFRSFAPTRSLETI